MENYLQYLDNLNQLVETQQARTTIWSLIHQYSGLFLASGLLLLVFSLFALSAIKPILDRVGTSGAIEGMLFCAVFFIIGLYGIADMIIYPSVTPIHEMLGITEESYTTIQNTITDMPDDDYNTLIKDKKTYKLTEKQQDEYKTVLTILDQYKH